MLSWLFIILSSFSWGFEIPQGLDSDDRQRTLEILGLGTATKFLSNAYPLGGYSGLEVSLSYEALDVEEVTRLGATSSSVGTVFYPKFNIGKGIYNNSDIFFHFIPFNETSGLSKYGFSYRWSFYESLYLPINFSLLTHASNANIRNKLVARSLGADILLGLTLSNFSLNMGAGWVRTTGDFTGGTQGVTDTPGSARIATNRVDSGHFMFGGTYNFEPFFMGASIDRYEDVVFNIKAGMLF